MRNQDSSKSWALSYRRCHDESIRVSAPPRISQSRTCYSVNNVSTEMSIGRRSRPNPWRYWTYINALHLSISNQLSNMEGELIGTQNMRSEVVGANKDTAWMDWPRVTYRCIYSGSWLFLVTWKWLSWGGGHPLWWNFRRSGWLRRMWTWNTGRHLEIEQRKPEKG